MTVVQGSGVTRAPRPSSLADVLDLILDKGLVIDAYVRVSLVGIEVLTLDARIVIASVDTYLHFAEAVNRLDLRPTETEGIQGFLGDQQDQGRNGGGGGGSQQGSPQRSQQRSSQRNGSGRQSITARSREKSDSGQETGSLARRIVDRGRWQEDT